VSIKRPGSDRSTFFAYHGELLPWAVGIGLGIACLVWAIRGAGQHDVDSYWQAAIRLRQGSALYADFGDPNATLAYRYAPWFAWVWIPLTYLPQPLVYVLWRALLFAAVAYTALASRHPWRLALTAPFLALSAWEGNVQAVMVGSLLYGVERRSGPIWIGLAASLKAAPLAFALVYAGRRQWLRFAVALATTAILVAPAFAYDLSGYIRSGGPSLALLYQVGPWAWAAVSSIAVVIVLGRPTWLTGSVATIAALPRLLLYDFSFLLVDPRIRGAASAAGSTTSSEP